MQSNAKINSYLPAAAHQAYRQAELEEVRGDLQGIEVKDIDLVARIGKISIWLPKELEEKLRGLISQKVAILKLDGYHVRCRED